ncbi:MAG: hypothetical protein E7321_00230 [Clostridiales bacterium]|nr:hypothetical protein [Clostridiales bacterium]
MIRAHEAIRSAQARIGTAYEDMDCIALIREVIRRSAGGVPDYRCEGTNWLWRSIGNSSKYRHLIWRQEGTKGARGGMLAFKRSGDDVHHVGLVTDRGTVIHSSSVSGCVIETPLDASWDCLGRHKHIAALEEGAQSDEAGMNQNDGLDDPADTVITIIDSAGNHFSPIGDWRVLVGSVD